MKGSKLVITFMALILAACGGDKSTNSNQPTSQNNSQNELSRDTTYPTRNQYPWGLACGWQVASNNDTMNIFYPDEFAKYWVALVPMLPETRLRINGRYPDARYFSYNVYDPLLRPSDAIADFEIDPDNLNNLNPFSNKNVKPGETYTTYVEFTEKPEVPAKNTVYAGSFLVGDQPVKQPLLTSVFYRTYSPQNGLDFDGGVGLPILTLETKDGNVEILPTADCVEPLLPTLGYTLPNLGINNLLLGIDIPDDALSLTSNIIPAGTSDAPSHVFRGVPEFYLTFLAELLGLPALANAVESQLPDTGSGGFLSNIHNSYIYNIYFRNKGNVILYRAKAPTYRGQKGVPFGQEQLRYWSICNTEVITQRYSACLKDEQIVLDDEGYFTVIVSDTADRPLNATTEHNLNWIPWGPYVDAAIVYRHMLPNPQFSQTISNIARGENIEAFMGDFAPHRAYCTKEIVEETKGSAKDVFNACKNYTTENL